MPSDTKHRSLNLRSALLGFALLTIAYLATLIWADRAHDSLDSIQALATAAPVLITATFVSYAIRYARWHWLLRRAGKQLAIIPGSLSYLSGLAFTATPGKVGELVRIRYLAPLGVRPALVLSAFVFERAFDLLATLGLAAVFASRIGAVVPYTTLVALVLGSVVCAALNPGMLRRPATHLRRLGALRLSRLARSLADGASGCRRWFNPLDMLVSFALSVLSCGLTALSFAYLLEHLGGSLALGSALGIYPLAMLAGAISAIPGGLGATELAIVGLLATQAISIGTATLAAIGIRMATLWLSLVCGLAAMGALEYALATGRMFDRQGRRASTIDR